MRNKKRQNYLLPAVGLAVVIVVLLLGGFVTAANLLPVRMGMYMMVQSSYHNWHVGLATLNALLLFVLLVIYLQTYLEVKSEFTVGLVVFTVVLLAYALTSNPSIQFYYGFSGGGPFGLITSGLTTLATLILLYLSLK